MCKAVAVTGTQRCQGAGEEAEQVREAAAAAERQTPPEKTKPLQLLFFKKLKLL